MSRIATFAITFVIGLALIIITYPHITEMDQSQIYSLNGNAIEEHVEHNSIELNRHSLVIRSETTGDIWVIEAERKDDDWGVGVKRDTVYLASATIVGLATFGSLVTIRVFGKPETRGRRKAGSIAMFAGAGIVISYQSFLMYIACCGSINVEYFTGLLMLTVAALISISIGFVLILDSWLKDEKDSSSTQK